MENVAVQVGKSFAGVMFENDVDTKKVANIETELKALTGYIVGEVANFFKNPVFDQKEKEAVLEKLSEGWKLSAESRHFFDMVVKQGLSKYMEQITASFSKTIREKQNEVHAKITSAYALSAEQQSEITKALGTKTGKKVTCEVTVDPELIGGMVANIGGVVFDSSIRGYLDRLQEELVS